MKKIDKLPVTETLITILYIEVFKLPKWFTITLVVLIALNWLFSIISMFLNKD